MKEHIENEIWDYLDDVLSADEKAKFEARLLTDQDLKNAFDELRGFDRTLESQIVHTAPKGLRSSILKKITMEESLVNQSLRVLFAVLAFIGLSSVVGAFIAIDRFDIQQDLVSSFSDSMSWMFSPLVVSLTGVVLLALIVEVYLLKPSTPK